MQLEQLGGGVAPAAVGLRALMRPLAGRLVILRMCIGYSGNKCVIATVVQCLKLGVGDLP